MFRHGTLPECEVGLVVLLTYSCQLARVVDHVGEVAPGEDAVVVVLVVFLHIEVNTAVAFVGISVGKNLLYKLFLLDDVACCVRLDARRKNVQRTHRIVVTVGVMLRDFHRFQLFEACLLLYFVVAFVRIMLQMAHISDVAHVAHLVPDVPQIAEENVEGDGRPGMPEMRITVNGRSADIHAHVGGCYRLEEFLLPVQRIVNNQVLHKRAVYNLYVAKLQNYYQPSYNCAVFLLPLPHGGPAHAGKQPFVFRNNQKQNLMIITTTPTIEGHPIQAYKGLVTGETIIGANVFKDFLAGIRDFIGGRSGAYEKVLREAKDTSLQEMMQRAEELGANAIVGIDLDYETVGQGSSMLMVTCSGTAVRIE